MHTPESVPPASRLPHSGKGSVASDYDVYGHSVVGHGHLRPIRLALDMVGKELPYDLYNGRGILLVKSHTIISPELYTQLRQRPLFCPIGQAQKFSSFNPIAEMLRIANTLSAIDSDIATGNGNTSADALNQLAQDLYEVWKLDADACLGYARLSRLGRPSISHVIHAALVAAEVAAMSRLNKVQIQEIMGVALTMNLASLRFHDEMYESGQRLDDAQISELHTHPIKARNLLQRLGESREGWLDGVSCHHENIDGSGYPNGIKAAEIPLAARIVRIADIFAARLTGRKNRSPLHWSINQSRSMQSLVRHIFGEDAKYVDVTLVTLLFRALGCFPPGSLVRLSNNELAVVVRRVSNIHMPSQVVSIRDYQGQTLEVPRMRGLGYKGYKIRNYANEESPQFADYDWQSVWGYAA